MRLCGANSLFVWLRLKHVDCELERLREEVPVSERGSNMADLVEVAKRYGQDARVVEGPLRDYRDEVPFIARMKSVSEGLYHFVVVTQIGPKDVETIDGTSGSPVSMPTRKFAEGFTGESIVRIGTTHRITPNLVAASTATNVAVWVLMVASALEVAWIGILLTKRAVTGDR